MPIDQLTDTGTTVVANPDGTFTRTDSSMPQRVLQKGKWVAIDTTLRRQADGTWAPKAAVTPVAFSSGGSGAMVTMHSGADKLDFSWPGALPAPLVAGDTATYPEVLPGVDLQLTADASGYSSILVVKTPKAGTNPRLRRLALNTTSANLTLTGTSNGGAQATDKRTGKKVFHSDTALMWDSGGSRIAARSPRITTAASARAEHKRAAKVGKHRARVRVKLQHGQQLLNPDVKLLTAKTTTYPVYIDPEWSGKPSQLDWARISDNGWNVYNSTSTSGATNAREGWDNNSPGNDERARTYYQMNTSGIKGAVVSHASLYVKQLSAASCSDTPAAVYGTDRPAGWSSSSLYWGHEPGGRTGALGTNPKSHEAGTCPVTDGANSWVSPPSLEFDVTSRAQSAAAGGWKSMTLMVQSPDMNDAQQWKQLAYGGGATMSVTYSYRPKLKNGTGTPAVKPSSVNMGKTMTTTHTPTLSARAVDPDLAGGSELVRVDYNVYNSAGTMVHQGFGPSTDSKKRARYNTNGSDWTTPSLPDGTYTWKATAQNAAGYWAGPGSGLWTKTQTFTVDTSAPPAPTVTSSQFPAKQIGAAYGDKGTFTLGNNHTNNITGYLFALDGTLGNTVYSSGFTPWTTGTKIAAGKAYYVTADNGPGTGTSVINGSASPAFAPGGAGPHTLYAKAVDQAGSTSVSQTSYAFYAGTSTPTYAYGDKMVSGWTATNADNSTTAVPKATITSKGGQLISQAAGAGYEFTDGYQAFFANKSTTSKVVSGDSATFSFDIPEDGPWSFGVNLTKAKDYGIYRLVLDAGQPTESSLLSGFDAYNSYVTTRFVNLGIPKDSSGQLLTLKTGVHTLTLTLTGKNPTSTGYQAGLDVLRLAPALTCTINTTSSCQNNTATSTFTTTASPADADGSGNSINSADLTSTAGWQSGKTVTVNGASVVLPKFGTGTYDNMLASGQTVTVPGSGVVNTGNAVVFLGFATGGAAKGATGTITYAKNNCLDPNGDAADQTYQLDTVPDWLSGPAMAASATLVHQNHSNNTQTSPSPGPKVYAFSVPLQCPGSVISSITLPLFTNGVQTGQPTLHILGMGVRPLTLTGSGTSAQHWVGTWSSVQDTAKIQQSGGTAATVNGQTLRIPAHISLGTDSGNGVRVHLSNAMGTSPVTFDAASVAVQDTTAGGATAAAAPTALTFGGTTSVTIPAGGDVTSSPVTLAVTQQATVLVSVQVHGSVSAMAGHSAARTPVWVSDAANRTGDTAATKYTQTTYTGLPYLAGIDVTTPTSAPTGSLILYGDQSVNGDTASGDGRHHLSDAVTGDIVDDPNGDGTVEYGVLNAGTNSNSLLPQGTYSDNPTNAINPLDRNVLAQGNVRTVLASTGATDLLTCSSDANTCATNVERGLAALNSELSSYFTDDGQTYIDGQPVTQNANITVYLTTIPPFTAARPGTATQEAAREQVNGYLLDNFPTQVIDFAAAVSTDGTATSSTVKTADLSGGNPSDAYYADLADRYLNDTNTQVVDIAPNLIVPEATGGDTPDDEWELAADGTDAREDNPFTAVGGATFNAGGPNALNAPTDATSFDGSTGFLESDHTAVNTLADYTISAWVKLDSATGPATAICEGTSQHQAFYLGYDRGNQGWMFQTTTTNDDSADFPTAEGDTGTGALGTWTHLLVTYTAPVDGDAGTGVMSIYQNGTLMGTATNLTPQYDSSMPLTIGGCVNSPDTTTPYNAFPGSVSDVQVYPYAMSAGDAGASSVIVPAGWDNGMPEDEWKLNANGTDTASFNAFTASGSAVFGTDAPSGMSGSVAFDGSTGFLKSKQSAVNTLGNYTVSAWVKINSALGTTAVCQGTTQHQSFYLSYDKPSAAWMFQTTTTNDENSDFPTAEGDPNSGQVGTWTHLVATFRAPVAGDAGTDNMALYQNGTLVGTASNRSPQYDSSMPLTIGGCVNSASATAPYLAFPGSVADVHVYPRTLWATEVSALR